MKQKRGISLIVLVITIVVILILAGVVILSLVNNNPIGQASEARFMANVDAYKSELNLAISQKYFDDRSFNPDTFDIPIWDGSGDGTGTIKQHIPSITKEDAKKFKIEDSKLVYVGTDELEIAWFAKITNGATEGNGQTSEEGLGLGAVATENTTFDGNPAAYNNPIIPKGFKAINDGTTWPADWNEGLVIEDEFGNQFVWVPVDGSNVPYAKWCEKGVYYSDVQGDDKSPASINEMEQITKYGGFYIGRFESGKDSSTLVVKKGAVTWTNINYPDIKLVTEALHNNESVKAGLITGTQWDTTMKWLENSEYNVDDSGAWGNHSNSVSPANVYGFGSKQVTGYSDKWKAKNIYDLAGNIWEWTTEEIQIIEDEISGIYRGGDFYGTSTFSPASYRMGDFRYAGSPGFRIVLYVQ